MSRQLVADLGIAVVGVVLLWQALTVVSWGLLIAGLTCMYLAALDPARSLWRTGKLRGAVGSRPGPGPASASPLTRRSEVGHPLAAGPSRLAAPRSVGTRGTPNIPEEQR